MTVEELLAQLNDLPMDALKKNIFVECGDGSGDTFTAMTIESIEETYEGKTTVIGYVLVEDKQLSLPFDTYDE